MVKVGIVGGGNAAHAMAALFPYKGFETYVLANYGNEADLLNQGIKEQGGMIAQFASHNEPNGEIKGTPKLISKHAKDIVPHVDVLILPLPSFAYNSVLTEIKPYLRKGMFIGVTPGQGGFDWVARDILGEIADEINFFAIMPMPFNCRISEFGKSVQVQTFKRRYRIGCVPTSSTAKAIEFNEKLFGSTESCGHFLSCTLYPINAIIHPQRLYTLLKDWKEGETLSENPLFYEQMTKEATDMMDIVNHELIEVSNAVRKHGIDSQVPHIYDFLGWVYSEVKAPDLLSLFSKNDAYKGFRCPFKKVDNGFIPDFENRYFTEDIPKGLCIYKGVADIVGVKTPTMDLVLEWAQKHMKKEYIRNGHLVGKDVAETNAPQRFGITTVEQLKGNH